MNDRTSQGDRTPERVPPDDGGLSGRLRDLDRRLDKSRAEHVAETAPGPQSRTSQGWGMALRLGADFVAGVLVGAAIGLGIDRLFGVSPWGLLIFLPLGFAAGVLSLLRTAGMVAKRPGIDDDPISRHLDE